MTAGTRNSNDNVNDLEIAAYADIDDTMFMEIVSRNRGRMRARLTDVRWGNTHVADFTISSTQLLALNATPRTILAAPPSGMAWIFEGMLLHKPAGTAYAGIAAGEDLAVKYTNASGLMAGQVETTGFLDQTTAQTRWCYPHAVSATLPITSVTPVAAVLVLHLLVGEITTGNSPLYGRVFARQVPLTLA